MKRKDRVVCLYDGPLLIPTTISKRRSHKSKQSSEERLKALELLIKQIANATNTADSIAKTIPDGSNQGEEYVRRASSHEGCLSLGDTESSYVGSTHWSTVLDDIQDLKSVILSEDSPSAEKDARSGSCASLFSSATPLVSLEQILDMLPEKLQVDRYLSIYFKARFIVSPTIHRYQFQRQYDQFWAEPRQASPLWISILFSILCISALLQDFEEVHTDLNGSLTHYFLEASAQCLILGDYTRPGKHCVEALLMFCQCKSLSSLDSSPELTLIFSIVVRLAFRSGYHRDPSAFSSISAFEGEMRRRTWALCKNYDLIIAFSPGLPCNIPIDCYDTKPPLNLQDDDFSETSASLPPSRPETEPTRILYIVVKDRLMTVFSRILHSSLSFPSENESATNICALDASIRAVHASIPPCLSIRPMSQSFADSAHVIMSRIVLEIITQKLLCTLYRRPMCRGDARSREICMTAAAVILTLLADLYREFQLGGQLEGASWMLNSTIVSDFTLAIMVLGLGLSQDRDTGAQRQGRVELLNQSLAICEDLGRKSWEAHRAAGALKEMLKTLQPQMKAENDVDSNAHSVGMMVSEMDTRDDGIWPAVGDKLAYVPGDVDWTFLDQYMYDANGAMPLTGFEGIFTSLSRVI